MFAQKIQQFFLKFFSCIFFLQLYFANKSTVILKQTQNQPKK